MVKNTNGGCGHKKMARKSHAQTSSIDMSDPSLHQVSVVKVLGDSRFHVETSNHTKLICHLPAKFSGKNKHRNFVQLNSLLLVAFREYENTDKHCDLVQIISATTPNNFFLNNAANNNLENDIVFTEERNQNIISSNDDGSVGVGVSTSIVADLNFDDI